MSALTWPLRLLAIVGPAAVLLWQVVTSPPLLPRQHVCLVAFLVLALAVTLSLLLVRVPPALLRHGDLLVPLGLYVAAVPLANGALTLPALAALAAPWWSGQILGLGLSLSAALVLQIGLAVFYGGWTTRLIVQAAERGRTDLVGALAGPWRWFGRVFVAEMIGWGVLLALIVPALAIASVAMPVTLIFIGVASLLWNLATAALLPVVVASRRPLGAALADGFRAGWREKGRWWHVVVVQMLLLGWVTFLSVSFTASTGPGKVTTKSTTTWNVNGFWTGGYEDNSRWYGKVAEVYETQPLALATTLLGLLFGVLAVAVKVRLVSDLRPGPVPVFGAAEAEPEGAGEEPAAARPGCAVAVSVMVLLLVVGLLLALAFRQSLADGLLLWQMHRAAGRGEPLGPFMKHVAQRDDSVEFAGRLSQDPDRRVRREMIAVLVGDATPGRKVKRHFGAFSDSGIGINTLAKPALQRLLADPDPDVRHQALRTVSGLHSVANFSDPLLHAVRAGDPEDRVIVAESLAHWNAEEFLKTFADPAQPREVRLAVLRGAETYGWAQVAEQQQGQLQESLKRVIDDPDAELRHAAIDAVRYATPDAATEMWLGVIGGRRPEDRRLALESWIDAVVKDETFAAEHYPFLEATEARVYRESPKGQPDAGRMALVIHVLCAAARVNTRELDQAAPVNFQQALADRQRNGPAAAAFVVELHRLQQVLRSIIAARHYARDYPGMSFSTWLPDEDANGPPPTRSLKDYLLGQAREPLAWCRNHGGGYASPFLHVNGRLFGGEDPARAGQVRALGRVLKDLRLDTDEALAASLTDVGAP
jgi:hypothetical protein